MDNASRDGNFVTTLLAVSSVDGKTPVKLWADPITHRLLVSSTGGGGGGTVSTVSVATANGFQGTVATATTTPVITIRTNITGVLKSNGTALQVAVAGTDFQEPISLTTTGSSGVATFTAGVLNIPNYVGTGGGTVTTVSVATANGFAGSVATATTTPVITVTTSVTGLLEGNGTAISAATVTGTGSVVRAISPTLVTPVLGVATATSINGLTITTTTGTLTLAAAKVLTVNHSLTLAGTDSTVMTFPTTNATIARTDAAQTFTGVQTMTSPSFTTSVVTSSLTLAVFNTGATTITAFGAAVTLTIGGTPTTAITHNYSTNVTAAATTKILNIGTGGAASSITTINIGSSAGGTTTINSNVLSLPNGFIELGHASDTSISRLSAGVLGVEGVAVPTISSSSTITNKRNQPRTNSTTTAATLAPDLTVANVYFRTTQTATLTISAPIGTPIIGETLYIEVSSVAAQTLTINATYVVFGAAFPATTTAGKSFMLTCTFNGTNWRSTWASEI